MKKTLLTKRMRQEMELCKYNLDTFYSTEKSNTKRKAVAKKLDDLMEEINGIFYECECKECRRRKAEGYSFIPRPK